MAIQVEVISIEDLEKWKKEFVKRLAGIFNHKAQHLSEGRVRFCEKDRGDLSVTISGKSEETTELTEILKDSAETASQQSEKLVATSRTNRCQIHQGKTTNWCSVTIELK